MGRKRVSGAQLRHRKVGVGGKQYRVSIGHMPRRWFRVGLSSNNGQSIRIMLARASLFLTYLLEDGCEDAFVEGKHLCELVLRQRGVAEQLGELPALRVMSTRMSQ
jgi:hypothetical protein